MLQVGNLFMIINMMEKTMFRCLSLVMVMGLAPLLIVFLHLATFFSILPVCEYTTTGEKINCHNQDAWILNGLRKESYIQTINSLWDDPWGAYLVGLYCVVQVVFSVGFGDIELANKPANQYIMIVLMVVGLLAVTCLMAKITSCIVGDDPEKVALQEKMTIMNGYLESHRVSKSCRRRVLEHYHNCWNKTHGVSPTSLLEALPSTLKTDVMKHLYEPALGKSPLFENLDTAGLRLLASCLEETYYSEGEFLLRYGDLCDDVFFIALGAVVCYNVRGDIMCQLGSGSLIGEVGPFFHMQRLYSAIAVRDVTAYVIGREQFINFLSLYPEIKKTVDDCSAMHYKEATAGKNKLGSGDLSMDLMLTFYNERASGAEGKSQGEVPRVEISPPSDIRVGKVKGEEEKSRTESSQMDLEANVDPKDLTRKVLKEDIMKHKDDLNSGVETKWDFFVTFGRKTKDEMGLVHVCQEYEYIFEKYCHF